MSQQPNRLDVDRPHLLGGTLIDRKRPLRFRLNGRPVDGFAGDSVLSAALASGIDTAGVLNGSPIALSLRFAPPIIRQDKANAPRPALPMAPTLAQDGVDYVTSGHAGAPLDRIWPFGGKHRRSLGVRLDSLDALAGPWRDMAATSAIACDVLVIGGGVAGMSAALAAARAGQSVTLVEAAGSLGGHCRYFGAQDGEETPDQSIARLGRSVAEFDTVTVLLRTRASAVHSGHARLHHVVETNGVSTNAIIDVTARHIILATGSLERLPVFSGNRLPGVVGSLEAYDLASRYGVWPGRSAIFATVTNAPYRLATRAADAGISITRIADARSVPESRFIEFSKAYGLPMALDTVAAQVAPSARGTGLAVVLQSGEDKFAHREAPLASDALIVAGGWQPDLTLWHMAGGHSRWEVSRARFEPLDGPAGLALAGSAAGHFSKQACIASGESVVAHRLGLKPVTVLENAIDPIYETADAWTPIAVLQSSDTQPSYLDAGASCVARPPSRPVNLPINWRQRLPFVTPPPAWSLADHPRTLGIGDVAAAIQLGTIPPQHGAIVAMERAANDDRLVSSPAAAQNVEARPTAVPAYLNGRFGTDPDLWHVASIDQRTIEIGALIFSDSDQSDPRLAIGTIVWRSDVGAIAVLGKTNASHGDHLTLRASDQTIVIELVSRDDPPAG